jgi:hypothetical protein
MLASVSVREEVVNERSLQRLAEEFLSGKVRREDFARGFHDETWKREERQCPDVGIR